MDEEAGGVTGRTWGSDLWGRAHAAEIRKRVDGFHLEFHPTAAYTKAKWCLWGELSEEEKAEWVAKGKEAHNLVKSRDVADVKPLVMTSRFVQFPSFTQCNSDRLQKHLTHTADHMQDGGQEAVPQTWDMHGLPMGRRHKQPGLLDWAVSQHT